jgi:hypothetical protein
MPSVALLFDSDVPKTGYEVPSVALSGVATTRFAAPDGFSQWALTGTVESGGVLEWGTDHGDEALYLESGQIDIDGEICDAGGAVIIERGAPARLEFTTTSSVVHFGQGGEGQPSKRADGDPAQVHVVPPTGVRQLGAPGSGTHVTLFTEASCPGCEIVLFRIVGDDGHIERSHSHSADEIIHVLEGTFQAGRNRIEPGMAIAVAAHTVYGYRTKVPWAMVTCRPGPAQLLGSKGELLRG